MTRKKITTGAFRFRTSESGIHLFDRKTGTNILLDELRVPPELWSKAPRHVAIALTNSCDLSCPHCYAPKHSARLTFERITRWLLELDVNGCLGIGFGGGEPTLHPDFCQLCEFAMTKTNLSITVTTHGHHLSKMIKAGVAQNLHFIRVSMDGVGNTYETIRNRSFQNLLREINGLRGVVPFGINYVVNTKTFPELPDALRIAEEYHAVELLLLPERSVAGIGGITPKIASALRKWISTYSGGIPLRISEDFQDVASSCNPLSLDTGLSSYAHIDASGTMKSSSFSKHGIPITDTLIEALKKLNIMEGLS